MRERQLYGVYSTLLPELASNDISQCIQYLRMDTGAFEEPFRLTENKMSRKTTKFGSILFLGQGPVTSISTCWDRSSWSKTNRELLCRWSATSENLKELGFQPVHLSTGLNKRMWPLTLSPPIPLRLYTLPHWSNPPFLIFNIRALWRSGLSARAP